MQKTLNIWLLTSLVISIGVLIPIVTVFFSFFEETSNYYEILKDTFLFEYIFNSFVLLVSVLFLTFLIGTLSAYFVSFYKFPFSDFFKWALILSFAVPPYIYAYSLTAFFENYGTLFEKSEGLIVLSGCLNSEVCHNILKGKKDEALKIASEYKNALGDRYFIEIQGTLLKEQIRVNSTLREIAKKLKIPVVATNDCHYLTKECFDSHDALLCIQTNSLVKEEKRFRFSGNEFYLKSRDEMMVAIDNVFPNFSPWGGFPRNLIYRFRPNGNREDSAIMEAMFLQRNHVDPEKQEPYEPIPIHYLSEDENWDDAEELTGIGYIFDQDMSNIPEVERGIRTNKRGKLTILVTVKCLRLAMLLMLKIELMVFQEKVKEKHQKI